MDSLQKIIDEIGLNEYINAVLVQNDGRPAFMIQPSDYNEKKKTDKITLKKLENIKKYFPDLYQLKTGWGIIISKKKLNSKSITNDKDVGKVLGYPCYKDFSREQNENEQLITYDIIIKLKNMPESQFNIMENCSRKYYDEHFTRAQAMKSIINLIEEVT